MGAGTRGAGTGAAAPLLAQGTGQVWVYLLQIRGLNCTFPLLELLGLRARHKQHETLRFSVFSSKLALL